MKKMIMTAVSCLYLLASMAQTDSTSFKAYLYNQEYDVYLSIDFYKNNITVPGQELFGMMPGYFGDKKDSRKWLITDARVDGKTAHLAITNDYGSEDLTADLTLGKDGNYELKQLSGSSLKIARNRKWVKIPKRMVFVKQ